MIMLLVCQLQLPEYILHQRRHIQRLLMHNLPFLIRPGQKQQLFNQLLHIHSLRANSLQALPESLLILTTPASQHIRIPLNNRHRRSQLMGSIRNKSLLLTETLLNPVQHSIKGFRQLRQLISSRRHRNTTAQIADFNIPHRIQQSTADKISQQQSHKDTNHNLCQQHSLNQSQQTVLRCNSFEKMQLVVIALNLNRHSFIIDGKIIRLHHLKIRISPKRRPSLNMALQNLQGGRIHITIIYHISLSIRNLQKHPWHQLQLILAIIFLLQAITACRPQSHKPLSMHHIMMHGLLLFLSLLLTSSRRLRDRQGTAYILLHSAIVIFQLFQHIANAKGQLPLHLMILSIIQSHRGTGTGGKNQHRHHNAIHQTQLNRNS